MNLKSSKLKKIIPFPENVPMDKMDEDGLNPPELCLKNAKRFSLVVRVWYQTYFFQRKFSSQKKLWKQPMPFRQLRWNVLEKKPKSSVHCPETITNFFSGKIFFLQFFPRDTSRPVLTTPTKFRQRKGKKFSQFIYEKLFSRNIHMDMYEAVWKPRLSFSRQPLKVFAHNIVQKWEVLGFACNKFLPNLPLKLRILFRQAHRDFFLQKPKKFCSMSEKN